MLVLTRKRNESIQIGSNIEIKVIGIEGDQVKLGISAPKSVEIHRKEIYLDIQEQNNEAANIPANMLKVLKDK
ncbi:carbon storage regulator CsrA [Oceanobacillus halophilus]|uniref:Translational regulator CsrA n=1 Tax=Oceanobacillus halophilus TaxID=930130 RepID=A0A495A7I0_9BACI|nr:carbon storage regulator CsrA [Oceanobacillus halophilus]RKQ35574.1 carbon storage regulator [Oceanobacillus halophilus]